MVLTFKVHSWVGSDILEAASTLTHAYLTGKFGSDKKFVICKNLITSNFEVIVDVSKQDAVYEKMSSECRQSILQIIEMNGIAGFAKDK